MSNLMVGLFCFAVGFLPPLNWLSCVNFFLAGLNLAMGAHTLIERSRR